MVLEIDRKGTAQIEKTSIVQQTAYWSEVKRKQGFQTAAFQIKTISSDIYVENEQEKNVTDDLLIILQNIDGEHQVAYVPYGPYIEPCEERQGEFLEALSEVLRSYLPKSCIMIRYDLIWQSPWAKENSYFENNVWLGPPDTKNQEIRVNFSTRNWNLRKSVTDILPSNTIFIDLKKDSDTLLKNMKPKTRYNIRLSYRKGVTVKASGLEEIDLWYDLYKQTAIRNGIYLHDIQYFKTILATRVNNSRSPAEVNMLMATAGNKPLAAIFLVVSGNRASYLYGASSSENRNYMGTYNLQWEAIKRAKEKGCTEYDMFGISANPDPSHPLYGLYRFKSGFGGEMYHRMGCWDYPLDNEKYYNYIAMELNSGGYHVN